MKSSSFGLLAALLLAGFLPMAGCYELPQVQGQGGAGGDTSSSVIASASSSSGQGGSGGSADSCIPDSIKPCALYSGPPGTENVGECKASASTCLQSGNWSGCTSEILPTAETCLSTSDVNCDSVSSCTGMPIATFPTSGSMETINDEVVFAMAAAPGKQGSDGALYAVGMRNAITSQPLNNARVLVWNQKNNGIIQDWSNLFVFTGGMQTNNAYATSVGVLPTSGDVVIAGTYFGGTLTIGAFVMPYQAAVTSFFTRISPNGAAISTKQLNSGGSLEVRDMAIDSAGNSYLVGVYTGTPNVPGISLPTASSNDGFIMCMSPDGAILWAQAFSGPAAQEVSSIAMTSNGEPVIAISFKGPMDVSTPEGQKSFDAGAENDILISRLDAATGIALWTTVIESSGNSGAISIADIAANDTTIAIGGGFRGVLSVSGNNYVVPDTDSGDIFVATLDAASGNFMNHIANQSPGLQTLNALALDSIGDLVISGSFVGNLALGSADILSSSTEADVYVVKLSSNLGLRWSRKFGDDPPQIAESVVIGNVTGHIYVGGGFTGTLLGANPPLSSTGGFDAYIVQLGD